MTTEMSNGQLAGIRLEMLDWEEWPWSSYLL